MENIINLNYKGIKVIKCYSTSGYNGHSYTIIHDNANGRYVGELEDTPTNSSSFMYKVKKLIDKIQ